MPPSEGIYLNNVRGKAMKNFKILLISAAILFLLSSLQMISSASPELKYNPDGSVYFITPDGKKKTVQMDGFTPYGVKIPEVKKTVRRRNCTVELIYSKIYSDDTMNGFIKKYFDATVTQLERWMYNNRVPNCKMKMIISNCRFAKTGYCRRKNKVEISVILYKNDKKEKEFNFSHDDLLKKDVFKNTAVKTVDTLMGK